MFVRVTNSGRGLPGLVASTLLALLLLAGCSTPLQRASPGSKDVCLRLSSMTEKPQGFRCGYYAARQVIQYYRPGITDENIRTDSLLFAKANDTVSVLDCLRDNVAIPLTMQNGSVNELFGSVASGDPVIVFVPGDIFVVGGFRMFGTMVLHCIVVAGHSADETELFFYSDGQGPYVISRKVFTHQWARVDNLCILRAR
jgi:hypothetical protein